MVLNRCPSTIVFLLILGTRGYFVYPIIPFILAEIRDWRLIYELYTCEKYKEFDNIELILIDSPLLNVWTNLKAAVYCLERSLLVTKAVATTSTAAKLAITVRCVYILLLLNWRHSLKVLFL